MNHVRRYVFSQVMNQIPSEFSQVYEDHVYHVYGFFSYRVSTRDLAEDLTQTTFERALRAWGRFDPRKASVRTWLMAISRNLLIDHHRRRVPDPVGELDERMLEIVEGPEISVGERPELAGVLSQLGEREREVIALRFGADLTGPEIAEVLDLSLANVQQITSRALKRLRPLLEAQGITGAQSVAAR